MNVPAYDDLSSPEIESLLSISPSQKPLLIRTHGLQAVRQGDYVEYYDTFSREEADVTRLAAREFALWVALSFPVECIETIRGLRFTCRTAEAILKGSIRPPGLDPDSFAHLASEWGRELFDATARVPRFDEPGETAPPITSAIFAEAREHFARLVRLALETDLASIAIMDRVWGERLGSDWFIARGYSPELFRDLSRERGSDDAEDESEWGDGDSCPDEDSYPDDGEGISNGEPGDPRRESEDEAVIG